MSKKAKNPDFVGAIMSAMSYSVDPRLQIKLKKEEIKVLKERLNALALWVGLGNFTMLQSADLNQRFADAPPSAWSQIQEAQASTLRSAGDLIVAEQKAVMAELAQARAELKTLKALAAGGTAGTAAS